jgi:hypothetical protein
VRDCPSYDRESAYGTVGYPYGNWLRASPSKAFSGGMGSLKEEKERRMVRELEKKNRLIQLRSWRSRKERGR